jgi:hypothetical protein
MDRECKTEVGGFFLPAETHILHDTCFPVGHRNYNEAVWTAKNMEKNAHMSMLWTCLEDGSGLNVVTTTDGNCSRHVDDTWSFHVEFFRLPRLAAGKCTEVLNEGAFQMEFVRMFNTNNVQEWPPCVEDNVFLAMIIMISCVICCMFCCTCAYCWYWRHSWSKQRKKAQEQAQQAQFHQMQQSLLPVEIEEDEDVDVKKKENGKVDYEVDKDTLTILTAERDCMKQFSKIVKVDGKDVKDFKGYEKKIEGKTNFTLTLRSKRLVEAAEAAAKGKGKGKGKEKGKDKGKSKDRRRESQKQRQGPQK